MAFATDVCVDPYEWRRRLKDLVIRFVKATPNAHEIVKSIIILIGNPRISLSSVGSLWLVEVMMSRWDSRWLSPRTQSTSSTIILIGNAQSLSSVENPLWLMEVVEEGSIPGGVGGKRNQKAWRTQISEEEEDKAA